MVYSDLMKLILSSYIAGRLNDYNFLIQAMVLIDDLQKKES